ncbi:MAG: metal ABC transporter substrate-binding protein [Candidatus Dadabacteria bacterium]|nr:metal ABC transporter substrate-binding protein [Candidatus Dadabacteria bacterium]
MKLNKFLDFIMMHKFYGTEVRPKKIDIASAKEPSLSFLDCFVTLFLAMTFLMVVSAQDALAKVRVVTSVPDFASIAGDVGGDKVEVVSLAKGYQDPHFVDAKPSYVLLLNKSDLLIYTGLDLEIGWLPVLVTGSRNSKISSAASQGNLDASTLVSNILEVPITKIDRSMGDLHPGGNPHYMLDPRNGIPVARGIADRLKEIDPENAPYYDERLKDFVGRLIAKIKEWDEKLAPYKGTEIVTYHKSWVYFSEWAGFKEVGYIEPKPGIPPSPSYVADLIKRMNQLNVKLVIAESYYPQKTPALVAEKASASFLTLPSSVDGREGIKTYFELFDVIVGDVTSKLEGMTKSFNSTNQEGG